MCGARIFFLDFVQLAITTLTEVAIKAEISRAAWERLQRQQTFSPH
jgi:hypothetical protein